MVRFLLVLFAMCALCLGEEALAGGGNNGGQVVILEQGCSGVPPPLVLRQRVVRGRRVQPVQVVPVDVRQLRRPRLRLSLGF
jgi:hypothetical protein